ncbi:hypothetical protein E2562_009981 [Oryza meyeriana var. granulata]|uniref:Uncharacterized protein n=1 Tax=Oryza meyeriana var. granulata TaxID=110450 RepID=A0A6G1EHK1_9ORYZ|nr:hypothetical protein E2562_009981 [Oryza meyeriana var. granulata]
MAGGAWWPSAQGDKQGGVTCGEEKGVIEAGGVDQGAAVREIDVRRRLDGIAHGEVWRGLGKGTNWRQYCAEGRKGGKNRAESSPGK